MLVTYLIGIMLERTMDIIMDFCPEFTQGYTDPNIKLHLLPPVA